MRWILPLLVVLVPALAAAQADKTVHWTADQVFPTSVRFLRIDEGVEIIEKDAEVGYVLFELTDDGKAYRGSLEIVTVSDEAVRLILSIDDRPEYMEQAMLDRLEQKLRDELGSPPKKKKKPAPPPDETK